jgi:hypothetical protein
VRKRLVFLVAAAMMLATMLAMSATAWAVAPKYTCTLTDLKDLTTPTTDLSRGAATSGLKTGLYSECHLQEIKPPLL